MPTNLFNNLSSIERLERDRAITGRESERRSWVRNGRPSGQVKYQTGSCTDSQPIHLQTVNRHGSERLNAEMSIQEENHIFAEQAGPSMLKVAEDALSNACSGRFEETSTVLKNALYFFVWNVITDRTKKDSLEHAFERDPERWTQSSLFMDACSQRALNSPRFLRPVEMFFRRNLKDQMVLGKLLDKKRKWPTLPGHCGNLRHLSHKRRTKKDTQTCEALPC